MREKQAPKGALEPERDKLFQQVTDHVQSSEYSYGLDKKLSALLWKRLRNEYSLSDLKKMTIDQNTEFTACFGSSSFTMTCYYDDHYTQHFFSYGKCGYVAYELHKLTGKPFTVFTDTTYKHGWQGHVGIRLDDNTILDVTGRRTHEQVIRAYNLKEFTINTVDKAEFLKTMKKEDEPFYGDREQLEQAAVQKIARDLNHDFIETY